MKVLVCYDFQPTVYRRAGVHALYPSLAIFGHNGFCKLIASFF